MEKLKPEERDEIVLCAGNFPYFCGKYCLVKRENHPKLESGKSHFDLYSYQIRLAQFLEDNERVVFSKFRGGEFTLLVGAYCIWKCLFEVDWKIAWLCRKEETAALELKGIVSGLPLWLRGSVLRSRDLVFPESNSKISLVFSAPTSADYDLLVVDEAVSVKPVTFGPPRCIIMSEVKKGDDWFYELLMDAKLRMGEFRAFTSSYDENPFFANESWKQKRKKELGDQWQIKIEQIPPHDLEVIEPEVEPEKPKITWRTLGEE